MSDSRETSTFRELDAAHGLTKGSAFRAFKQVEPELSEGEDFELLQATNDAARIEDLRASERIYPGSVNVVLLQPAAARRVSALLEERD